MKSKQNQRSDQRKSLLTGASILAAAAATMAGAPAFAQDADEEEAIVVTGSRIPQPNLVTTNPVTQLTAEDITTQGVTRLEDLTNQLPQVFATQGSNVSNGSSGTAEISLRGLGAGRTLVLIDGRRMPYGSDVSSAADINVIPGAMVERVEVLTGGASAIYGSDAISGVVNFIMRDDFEGLRFDAQYGFYQHENDTDQGNLRTVIANRAATNPAQFRLPEDSITDGIGKEVSVIFGASSPDRRGNVTAYVTYRTNDAVLQANRDYSSCSLGAGLTGGNTTFTCGGSGTSYPGLFITTTGTYTIDSTTGNTFRPFSNALDQYNFGPLNYYQRPDERYTLGAFAHYEINESIEAYAQLMFSDYASVAQIAPSGNFLNTSSFNCGNPFLSASQAADLGCSPADILADTIVPGYVARRNVEGGGRQDTFANNSFRVVAGLRGPLSDTWDYDVSAQFSEVTASRTYLNELSVTRLGRALDVVDADPGPGVNPQCRSFVNGTDPACVPWNIWSIGGVTQASLDYLQVPLLRRGTTTQQLVTASATGELPVTSPWAESPIAASFGIEYREDYMERIVDASFASGDGAGQGGPTLGFPGASADVFEVFGEVQIPIAENQPLADYASLSLAYRSSHYSNNVTTDTYNVGADWAPIEDFRLRASYARAVRAPNVIELFSAQGLGLFDMTDDPCDANDPAGDGFDEAGVCIGGAAYQVSATESTNPLLTSPAGQYNGLFGGNPNVGPESADTWTYGFVWQPSFIPGFSLSLDYFKIEVTNLIGVDGAAATVNACFGTAANPVSDPAACARITRNPTNGTLWIGTNNQVEDLNTNVDGTLSTEGYDMSVNYGFGIGSLGDLNLNLIATLLEEYNGGCEGLYGAGLCGTPNPELRGRFRATWDTPWDLQLTGTVRYFDEVTHANPGIVGPDKVLEAQTYLDLAGNYDLFENTSLRFGVNNVLDREPPISRFVGAGFGNGNTFPQVYDSLGRWVFMGITVDF